MVKVCGFFEWLGVVAWLVQENVMLVRWPEVYMLVVRRCLEKAGSGSCAKKYVIGDCPPTADRPGP